MGGAVGKGVSERYAYGLYGVRSRVGCETRSLFMMSCGCWDGQTRLILDIDLDLSATTTTCIAQARTPPTLFVYFDTYGSQSHFNVDNDHPFYLYFKLFTLSRSDIIAISVGVRRHSHPHHLVSLLAIYLVQVRRRRRRKGMSARKTQNQNQNHSETWAQALPVQSFSWRALSSIPWSEYRVYG